MSKKDTSVQSLSRPCGPPTRAPGDPCVLFQEILSAAVAITQADAGTIQLLDAPSQSLTFWHHTASAHRCPSSGSEVKSAMHDVPPTAALTTIT